MEKIIKQNTEKTRLLMIGIISLLLVLIVIFSGCMSQEEVTIKEESEEKEVEEELQLEETTMEQEEVTIKEESEEKEVEEEPQLEEIEKGESKEENIPEVSAENIRDLAVEASKNVSSFKFKLTRTTKASASGQLATFVAKIDGETDVANKITYISLTTNMFALGRPTEKVEDKEIYLTSSTKYFNGFRSRSGNWFKTDISSVDYIKDKQNQLGMLSELIKDKEVEIVGEEKIDDKECYVLKVKSDDLDIFKYVVYQEGGGGLLNLKSNEDISEFSQENVEHIDTNLIVWVTKDTYLFIRTNISMNMDIKMWGSLNETVILTIYEPNAPAFLKLPYETKDAEVWPPKSKG